MKRFILLHVIIILFASNVYCGADEPLFLLDFPGESNVIDYSKYGEFTGVGTEDYRYIIKDREGLAKAEPKVAPKLSERDTTPPRIYLSQRAIEIVSSAKKTVRGQAIDESGVALVYVNNREAQIDEKGNFQADILLKPGLNNIVIEAIDIYNNKATKTFIMTRKSQVAKKIEPKEDILNIKGKYL